MRLKTLYSTANWTVVLVILALVFCRVIINAAEGYTCHPSGEVPFEYDPNAAAYRVIAAIEIAAGESFSEPIRYDDPDGDPIVAGVLSGPPGFTVAGDANDWSVSWTPGENDIGLHYIDIEIEDIPQGGDPLTDAGTILVMVYKPNSPPILRWLCGD